MSTDLNNPMSNDSTPTSQNKTILVVIVVILIATIIIIMTAVYINLNQQKPVSVPLDSINQSNDINTPDKLTTSDDRTNAAIIADMEQSLDQEINNQETDINNIDQSLNILDQLDSLDDLDTDDFDNSDIDNF